MLGDPYLLSPEVETAEWIQISIMIGRQIIMRSWRHHTRHLFKNGLQNWGKWQHMKKWHLDYLKKKNEVYKRKWGEYLAFIEGTT